MQLQSYIYSDNAFSLHFQHIFVFVLFTTTSLQATTIAEDNNENDKETLVTKLTTDDASEDSNRNKRQHYLPPSWDSLAHAYQNSQRLASSPGFHRQFSNYNTVERNVVHSISSGGKLDSVSILPAKIIYQGTLPPISFRGLSKLSSIAPVRAVSFGTIKPTTSHIKHSPVVRLQHKPRPAVQPSGFRPITPIFQRIQSINQNQGSSQLHRRPQSTQRPQNFNSHHPLIQQPLRPFIRIQPDSRIAGDSRGQKTGSLQEQLRQAPVIQQTPQFTRKFPVSPIKHELSVYGQFFCMLCLSYSIINATHVCD